MIKGKVKVRAKERGGEGSQQMCHKFSDASGCRFGDACIFKHDRAKARRENKCLACGQEGHFRPECPIVAPENRQVAAEGGAKGRSGSCQCRCEWHRTKSGSESGGAGSRGD